MSSSTSGEDAIAAAFGKAQKEFEADVKDPSVYKRILETTTIEQVYDFTDQLQEEQGKAGRLRTLTKIQPYLEGLRQYAAVVEQFVQIKPDLLCLIWGPIKLLLLWTNNLQKSLDEIIQIMGTIGDALPQFQEMARIFHGNDRIQHLLLLFFKDILHFYRISLEFFTKKRWKLIVESVWPRYRTKLDILTQHIERHSSLMREEVTLQNIREEHQTRQKALEEYDLEAKFRLRRDFDAIQEKISPRLYYDRFSHLQETSCVNTDEWLQRDKSFVKWMDVDNESDNILWLSGIPGAGKTYLAGMVAARSKPHKTVYAFLSHHNASTSALSVLHTLLFQLGEENDDVKEMVNRINIKSLQTSTECAAKTLSDAIGLEGSLYIVIDGLDEIDKVQRSIILHRLCSLAKTEPHVRLLFSARPEYDIEKSLKTNARVIKVNNENTESIEAYVKMRTARWFVETEGSFDISAQSTIRALVAPLAGKARGMFLYVRIVLDNVMLLYDVEDIKEDLKALPENLDEAYGRLFTRIRELNMRSGFYAMKLLGWVSISPEPLTTQELEQALLITAENDAPLVSNLIRPVELCGPLVEVIDDTVRLVHFTAKEYIFSEKIPSHLDVKDATADLLSACVIYLSSRLFDKFIAKEQMEEDIRNGLYRFTSFATTQWLNITLSLALDAQTKPKHLSKMEAFAPTLKNFIIGRANGSLVKDKKHSSSIHASALKMTWPDVYETLSSALDFQYQAQREDWSLQESQEWSCHDPLDLSSVLVQLYNQMHNLVCSRGHRPDCDCRILLRHYGSRLFKCDRMVCPHNRHGFLTNQELDRHTRGHARSHKCPIEGCEYATIGFMNSGTLQAHFDKVHTHSNETGSPPLLVPHGDSNLTTLLEIVKAGNTEAIRSSMLTLGSQLTKDEYGELVKLVISSGSIPVFDAALESWLQKEEHVCAILLIGIELHQVEAIRWVGENSILNYNTPLSELYRMKHPMNRLPHYLRSLSWIKLYEDGLRTGSLDIFDFLEEKIMPKVTFEFFFDIGASLDTSDFPDIEARMLDLWQRRALGLSPERLGSLLIQVGRGSCSIARAKILLDLGAKINYSHMRRSPTALQYACRKTSRSAADFARFLLLKGASAETASQTKRGDLVHVRDEAGALGIAKWLGMPWDELVSWAEAERNSRRASGLEGLDDI